MPGTTPAREGLPEAADLVAEVWTPAKSSARRCLGLGLGVPRTVHVPTVIVVSSRSSGMGRAPVASECAISATCRCMSTTREPGPPRAPLGRGPAGSSSLHVPQIATASGRGSCSAAAVPPAAPGGTARIATRRSTRACRAAAAAAAAVSKFSPAPGDRDVAAARSPTSRRYGGRAPLAVDLVRPPRDATPPAPHRQARFATSATSSPRLLVGGRNARRRRVAPLEPML